jgi:hypothetical protein
VAIGGSRAFQCHLQHPKCHFASSATYRHDGVTTQFFGMKIRRYMSLVEISPHVLALVAEKAYANSALTDRAWRREPVRAEAILASGMISDPLTKLMFCSPTEGAVALVLASEKKAKTLGRAGIRIAGAGVRTRVAGSFEVFSPALDRALGPSAAQRAHARPRSRFALPTAKFMGRRVCRPCASSGAAKQHKPITSRRRGQIWLGAFCVSGGCSAFSTAGANDPAQNLPNRSAHLRRLDFPPSLSKLRL